MASTRIVRLGVVVPSSNTAMEPEINTILTDINARNEIQITAHFSRMRVTQISLEASAKSQFNIENMLHAASLLADTGVAAIAWGGTSAGWLGIDSDRKLCAAIEERFHVPATTSTLALIELVHMIAADGPRIGLVTPYIAEMNEAIRENFRLEGIDVVDHRGLSITDNRVIATVTTFTLEQMVNQVLGANPHVKLVALFCTNLSTATEGVIKWETEYAEADVITIDSVAATIWGILRIAKIDIPNLGVQDVAGRIFTFPKDP